MGTERKLTEKSTKTPKPEQKSSDKRHAKDAGADAAGLATLQRQVGNRAVQRLVGQRADMGVAQTGGQLSDGMAQKIDRARSGEGQPLDKGMQARMGAVTGQDYSNIRVHTNPEADRINRELDSRAFTIGRDMLFRDGEYNPRSTDGQELIAHEATHVAQQRAGTVDSSGQKMSLNAPRDAHEQQADRVARKVVMAGPTVQREEMSAGAARAVQRQGDEELEELGAKAVQRQDDEELEELGAKAVQRQDDEELEELGAKAVRRQDDEELEELSAKAVQRQDDEELEELGAKAVQRQDDEELEELGAKAVQRQDDEELEELGAKAVQRQDDEELEELGAKAVQRTQTRTVQRAVSFAG